MNEINTSEERLRAEVEELKRQLAEQKKLHEAGAHPRKGPSAVTLLLLALTLAALVVGGFFACYLARQKREEVLAAESKENSLSLPSVNFARVERSSGNTELGLPGNIQAGTEAPILARATGYIRKRYVDIGDRVKGGQVVAEVEAPELDQMILQAKASIETAQSAEQQARGRRGAEGAEGGGGGGGKKKTGGRVTSELWDNLQKRGVVSKQENDAYQA